jgi:4a-hydroxytetrahydrobiopterin dehydratase
MNQRKKLNDEEVQSKLPALDQWVVANGMLHKQFQFPDFVKAFSFMTSVALLAESLNHHPNWSNVYNRVTIDLMTHDLGGITEFDFTLAENIDMLLK